MSNSWEIITESLRNELQEYGALLGLYDEQQANLLKRDADAVLSLASAIEAQVGRAQAAREVRERLVRSFATNHGASADSTLRALLPLFPEEVQPLFEALMTEINHLIHRIRRDARQNQMLLSRAVETHEAIVRLMRPAGVSKTYSARGDVSLTTHQTAWQAAG
ncbi:flagellar protein FlgN [Nibricoccus sp. IMCC34717]|uniref:flagellar protein FlgN n=1 Tax=Nibricoccus sp. IMCC34717 TaxID=3034021 RepID=UPI00384CF7BE